MLTGPLNQHHLGAGGGRRCGDGVALLAGRAVGDVAHRIDRLVGRAGRDQHALAGKRSGPGAAALPPRRRFRAARPCGRGPLRRARPSRPRSGRRRARRRRRAARDCAASPWPPTSAGSSPARCRIGLSVASSTAVARSSAWPPAIFAIRSAVAGATTMRSVSRARRIWPTSNSLCGSNRSVKARSPLSAPAASGVTKCCAAAVRMQRTWAPRSCRRRMRSSDL